jgi:hypothetical protein
VIGLVVSIHTQYAHYKKRRGNVNASERQAMPRESYI